LVILFENILNFLRF